MATTSEKSQLPTVKDLHNQLVSNAKTAKARVLNALGVNGRQVFYDVLSGRRKLNKAEKAAIAEIYGVGVDEINWNDDPFFVS